MRLFFLFCFLLFVPIAQGASFEFSGNIEGQLRNSKNNEQAKDELFQDWDSENFYLLYGNLNTKYEMDDSRIESNIFTRYSQSELYDPEPTILGPRDPYFATNVFTFPNKLVARDIFQLQHVDQSGNQKVESVINKLYYEVEFDQHRFMIGRMYINYGQGEIFNPINPFNQPTGLTSISQVAQGNDGISFTFFLNDKYNVQLIALGDKSIESYKGKIDQTYWVHGEYQVNDQFQFDFVFGEDQKRRKFGTQLSYQFEEAMVFTQLLYQSQNIENEPSNNLWDALLGYDQQLTNIWHIRFEGGYQKSNRYATFSSFERFLPTEYFAAVANVVEVHPLFKVSGSLINDIKSGFSYFIGKGTWNFSISSELELFGFSPIVKGDEADNLAQKLVTTDVGLALRVFF